MFQRTLWALASAAILMPAAALAQATVGKPAPALAGTGADGKPVSLADFKGKYVVVEWTNPQCPFVKKHYASGNMPATQKAAVAKGAAWLSVQTTPGADAKVAPELVAWQKASQAAPTASVIDAGGAIGQAWRATTTPHLFIVNPQGTVVYAGAIDDKPTANAADIAGATNYVNQALAEAMAGKPVSRPVTQAYGCSVKYPGA